jgi:hypothetical protein
MKRGAPLFSKKFLRNAAIVLVIAVVAYVVMYGVREGFQAASNANKGEYTFNVKEYTKTGSNIYSIPALDYKDKTIKDIKVYVWGPSTGATKPDAEGNAITGWILPPYSDQTPAVGGPYPLNRSTTSDPFMEVAAGPQTLQIRKDSKANRFDAKKNIVMPINTKSIMNAPGDGQTKTIKDFMDGGIKFKNINAGRLGITKPDNGEGTAKNNVKIMLSLE